jgi:asparagine synthase (glutamine-hydrolysing)
MCGINGVYNYSGASAPNLFDCVQRMNDAVRHRGPDGEGVWGEPKDRICMGHRRLSIIDLSDAGAQPMHSPEGTTMVFNGEIYNHRELRSQLPAVEFRSHSDTEVLLRLFDRFGPDCLARLNGMFSFAIWQPKTRQLFVARDRIGIKPFYYTQIGGMFAFSSEIKALLTLPWVRAELDEVALYHFLTFGKLSPPLTMFRGIKKLAPGHYLTVRPQGAVSEVQYWEVEYSDMANWSVARQEEAIEAALDASVRRRLVSDVPVGAFLSGGVDSSAVVAMMQKYSEGPIKTYSIGFEGAPGFDESEHARRVAGLFGVEHVERNVTARDIRDLLPNIVDLYDEPLADATSIPIYYLSELARQNGSTVVLTGDGADETFFGYRNWIPYVRAERAFEAFGHLPRIARHAVTAGVGALFPDSRAEELFRRAARGEELFWGGANAFKEGMKPAILGPHFRERLAHINSEDEVAAYRTMYDTVPKNRRAMTYGDWLCYYGLKSLVPNRYLYRADRLGMAHGVELRVPFLDHEIVNLALSLPMESKLRAGTPKAILKSALRKTLPNDVLYRKKQGFCVPLRQWAGDIMLDYLDDRLDSFSRRTGMFDAAVVRRHVRSARDGRANHTSALWTTYFLMTWYERWFETPAREDISPLMIAAS